MLLKKYIWKTEISMREHQLLLRLVIHEPLKKPLRIFKTSLTKGFWLCIIHIHQTHLNIILSLGKLHMKMA
jgi:hypothetical protein